MEPRQRRHLLVFETERGLLSLETDDLFEVSEQRWFKEFLNVADIRASSYRQREEEYEEPVPASPPQARQPPRQQPQSQPEPVAPPAKSFLMVAPNQMSKGQWDALTGEQQQEYVQYYGLEKPQ